MRKLSILIVLFTIFAMGVDASKKIVVDLSKQRATAYKNGEKVFSGRISSGKAGHRTPTGSFRVLEKDKYHRSNIYPAPNGGAKMFYMLRLTNHGIALHLGRVPNYPASHGCIRMRSGFAQKMYSWANVGTRVYVKNGSSNRSSRSNSSSRSSKHSKRKRKHRSRRSRSSKKSSYKKKKYSPKRKKYRKSKKRRYKKSRRRSHKVITIPRQQPVRRRTPLEALGI